MNEQLKILLLDDNPDDRMLVLRELNREFPKVHVEQVLQERELGEALGRTAFDLVITDFQLRWTTGIEVIRSVKAVFPDCPVVMFTATGSQEIAVEAMKAGLDDYVIKSPQHYVRLAAAVRSCLDRAEIRRRAIRSETRLQSLLDRLNVAVFRASTEGELWECNGAFHRLLGTTTMEEAQQLYGDELFPTISLEELQRATVENGGHAERERKLVRGERVIWLWLTEAVTRINGERVIDGIVEDISARKQADERIRELNETLERRVADRTAELVEANAALEAFAYSVSHDLREPLRNLQGYTRALREDCSEQLSEEGRSYVARMEAVSERMDQMIHDLFEYSRVSRTAIPCERIELGEVVTEARSQLASEVASAQAEVRIDEPLPAVIGHSGILVQIVANLLDNAIKFVAGDERPRVHIYAEQLKNEVRLWVADNGIGIAAEDCKRVFNVFERLHGAEVYPGTGIGLAIVRKGAERLGGQVGVETEPAKGSRFWVTLPKA